MPELPKKDQTRLKGKPLAALNNRIWERDEGCCILCGAPVPQGTKFHHILFRSHGGGDEEDNGVTLCQTGNNCHGRAHGPEAKKIRAQLQSYIEGRKAYA